MLRVQDTGIGIPPDLLPRIFDLFAQGEPARDRTRGGLGIGLTLVRRLVEHHGGTVTAESEGEGRGSTFTVRLPAIAPPIDQPVAPLEKMVLGHRRVLIVEDDEDSREMLRMLLVLHGHEVFDASDGASGVELARQVRPDLALIDLGLPGLDGLEVARKLRSFAGDGIKLVALTGWDRSEDRVRVREAGFDAHLVKPVDQDKLDDVLGGE